MENIPLPSFSECSTADQPNVGTLVVEPLYPGYGTTIGNAMRRTLLSSLPGAAVTAVKIKNAPHEFTTLPKVQEDTLQIILNLKQLRLKVFSDEPVRLHVSAKGEQKVTAGDIEKNSDVEIANPDLVLATLTSKDASIDMDIWVNQGRGFVPTEARGDQPEEVGVIAVDAFYSPVRRVSFRVESARVGQMTNFDKLSVDIETDGTISPEEAVKASTAVLVDHFALIGKMESEIDNGTTVSQEQDEESTEEVTEDATEDSKATEDKEG